jgi:hypothetical protein
VFPATPLANAHRKNLRRRSPSAANSASRRVGDFQARTGVPGAPGVLGSGSRAEVQRVARRGGSVGSGAVKARMRHLRGRGTAGVPRPVVRLRARRIASERIRTRR